jgi:hypothetical protein
MTPEEQLASILKQNQNIVFGKTIGTDANGNCTVQTGENSILARSGGQISAGDCVAMKTDDGQWYAVSSRVSGTVDKKTLFKRKNAPISLADDGGIVKVLLQGGNKLLIGGDRETPAEIYTIPDGFGVEQARISTTGEGVDDWIVQVVLRKQSILEAYNNRSTYNFLRYYLENKSLFTDSMSLTTITPLEEKEILDDGIIKGSESGFRYTKQQTIRYVYDVFFLSFLVRETYQVELDFSHTVLSRTCDIQIASAGNFDISPYKDTAIAMRSILLDTPLLVIFWKTLSDSGLPSTYDMFTDLETVTSGGFSQGITPSGNGDGDWLINSGFIANHGWWSIIRSFSPSSGVEPDGLRDGDPYWTDDGKYTNLIDYSSFPNALTMDARSYGYFASFDGSSATSIPSVSTYIYSSLPPIFVSEAKTVSFPISASNNIDISVESFKEDTPYTLSNDQSLVIGPVIYYVEHIIGFGSRSNIVAILQGVNKETELVVTAEEEFRLYKEGLYNVVIPNGLITASNNLIDDTIAQVVSIADESADIQVFQLLATAQPDPTTETIDMKSIAGAGTPLNASTYLPS